MDERDVTSQTSPLSPDGNWLWDGSSWITTIHPGRHWSWNGSEWETFAQPVERGIGMTIISALTGLLTFAILFIGLAFVYLSLNQLLRRAGWGEADAWFALAAFSASAIGVLAGLGVCLALLNRRWWLKG